MTKKKRIVFTTSQTAKILNVSKETIINWINKEYITAFHTIGGHYRIHLKSILKFADKNNIFVDNKWYELLKKRCLLVSENKETIESIKEFFNSYFPEVELNISDNFVKACIEIGIITPTLCIWDSDISNCDSYDVLKKIRSDKTGKLFELVVLSDKDIFSQKEIKKIDIIGIIKKPINDRILYKILNNKLKETNFYKNL